MSDFRTSLQTVLAEVHRRTANDINMATLNLCKAMFFHKSHEFWFNTATSLFVMVAGTQSYPRTGDIITTEGDAESKLPSDMYVPKQIQIRVGGDWWDPMEQKDITWIRAATFDENTGWGYPQFYAHQSDSYLFYPIPQAAFLGRVDLVRDVPRPRWSHTGSAWVFEEYDSTAEAWITLTPDFTNEWLTNAPSMIEAWAKWKLYAAHYKDKDAAKIAWAEYQMEYDQLMSERDGFSESSVYLEASSL